MKILILKPSSLGDVVQAIPVLRLLKAQNPANEIYWWISADLAELLQGDRDLSGIFLFERRRWAFPQYWSEMFRSIHQMRAHQFDWIIDLQGLARSSLISWLAHGNLSIGVEDWREGAPGLYDVVVPRPSPSTHAVDWYLEVLKALDVPRHWDFVWMPERPVPAANIQRKWHPAKARWIIINPGARWSNKRWPVEYYAAVVRELAGSCPAFHFAILGSTSDKDLGAAIAEADRERCLNLTGRTSLAEMIEWIRLSELIVTNDTGPMHVAAALNKPIISVFGPTDPHRTGPYGQLEHALRISLPCAPCLKSRCHYEKPMECLRAISPAAVCSRIKERLLLE